MTFRTRSSLLLLTTLWPLACGQDDDDPGADASSTGTTGVTSSTSTSPSTSATSTTQTTSATSATSSPGSTSTTSIATEGTASSTATDGTETDGSTGTATDASTETDASTGETEGTPEEKVLFRDLLPDLQARTGMVPEKIESVAIHEDGTIYIANDNDGVSAGNGETQLFALDGAEPTAEGSAFQRVATFPVCAQTSCDNDDETVAEIVAATDDGMTLIYTDGVRSRIGFVDIEDPTSPTAAGVLDTDGEPTSVAVHGPYALVAVDLSDGDFTSPSGALLVVDIASQTVLETFPLEGQPDAIAVSSDGAYAAIVLENQRDEELNGGELPQAPPGVLVVMDISADEVESWTASTVALTTEVGLYAPEDPEPEFVDINADNIAAITLQENNGIVLVDLETATVITAFDAGTVDLDQVDTVEESPALISLVGTLEDMPREPDAIAWISNDRMATADEGDLFGGSRTFTIFSTAGEVMFTSGHDLEHTAVRLGHYPDGRSENKGAEPEGIEFGRYEDTPYLFVGSERASLLYVYDLSDTPRLHQVLPTATSPEGLLAIPSRNLLVATGEVDDRGGKVRAGISIYTYGAQAPTYPTLESTDRADGTPIPWGALSGLAAGEGDTFYAVLDSFYQRSRILTLDVSTQPARIVGEVELFDRDDVLASLPVVTLVDPTVDDDDPTRIDVFDEADLAALRSEDGSVNLDLEGITVAAEGGFWVVSEGAGTAGDANHPINSRNLLLKVDTAGVIERAVMLPSSVNEQQLRFGFEGVAEYDGRVYVAFQRAWLGEPNPRIGIYDPADDSWSFVVYPLDPVSSPNGGWVGLSEITSRGDGTFIVLERDDQGGPDAAIKRLYAVDPQHLAPVAE